MKKNTFKMTNEEGKEVEYTVLFTFESDETGKKYIAYTDYATNEDDSVKVYANTYEEDEEGNLNMIPIETSAEWKIIEKILKSIEEKESKE